MFGTLVICLPSAHEGGELVVRHRGSKMIFRTSDNQASYACWYSDVHHEVLPVNSGYRLVLTYNLVLDHSNQRPCEDLQTSEMRLLHDVIGRWLLEDKNEREIDYVYYKLDHEYTEASISLNNLKGQDWAQVQALRYVSSQLPVDIFLAVLEKEEMGGCDSSCYNKKNSYWDEEYEEVEHDGGFHPIDDICSTEYKILSLVDLDGCQVAKDMKLDETKVLQEDCFNVNPEEYYEGYMGNYVCTSGSGSGFARNNSTD